MFQFKMLQAAVISCLLLYTVYNNGSPGMFQIQLIMISYPLNKKKKITRNHIICCQEYFVSPKLCSAGLVLESMYTVHENPFNMIYIVMKTVQLI